eukprot:scaffold4976_cov161-Amphora_coffeaeformis.AAC.1
MILDSTRKQTKNIADRERMRADWSPSRKRKLGARAIWSCQNITSIVGRMPTTMIPIVLTH